MKRHGQGFRAMGSPCEIQLYAATEAEARRIARVATDEVERLEARYSRYRDESFLSEINRVAAQGGSIEVDAETAGLLDYAATCHRESGGLFDVTSGALRRVWSFQGGALPERGRVEALLEKIGWEKLRWEPPRLTFPVAGMELDLGGVVKEYAADRAAALCLEAGGAHGMLNLGGDIRVIGPHPDGQPWQIGIRDPRRQDALLCTVPLASGGLATSGDYERCIEIDGTRYGHVLHPRTGWPVRDMASVTVIGDLCVVAGSSATIAMLKEDEGPVWLAQLGLSHLWVDVDGCLGGPLAP